MAEPLSRKPRAIGGLLAAVVGDALGLPYEGTPRRWLDRNPAEGMTGGGPHGRPAGCWSDDGSLLLCLTDSLCRGFEPGDVAARFLRWWHCGLWTPAGHAFGYGATTAAAMQRLAGGASHAESGEDSEWSNGNGSLMRTLPLAIYFSRERERMLRAAHQVSAITHAHPRAQMCCGLYCLVARRLLRGEEPAEAVEGAVAFGRDYYARPPFAAELRHLETVLSLEVLGLSRFQVPSGGYVVETLEAALWSLARAKSLKHALLIAVNLGGDTDTVGCVTGGLAGLRYGRDAIPAEWLAALPRRRAVEALCERFWNSLR